MELLRHVELLAPQLVRAHPLKYLRGRCCLPPHHSWAVATQACSHTVAQRWLGDNVHAAGEESVRREAGAARIVPRWCRGGGVRYAHPHQLICVLRPVIGGAVASGGECPE